jgi:hypothetical protein
VLALVAATAAEARHAPVVMRISSDPYSGPGAQHATEVEPDSFATNSTVVSAFQVGRRSSGGASNNGFATGRASGKTFASGFLPGITTAAGGPYDWASDPSVAYDAAHRVWMVSSLAGMATGQVLGAAVVVSRSADGIHWSDPVTVAQGGAAGGLDKNWTVCDNNRRSPFFGHCYTEFDDFLKGLRLEMSTSTDGGRTWSPSAETQGGGTGSGGVPIVQPNGTVVVPFRGGFGNPFTIGAFRSTDGGHTWSAPVTVSQISFRTPPALRSGRGLPSVELDRAGNVYVVWADCRFRAGCSSNDLVLSKSSDGLNWTAPTRIPIDPVNSGADHFIPGLAVDPHTAGSHARLALTYYSYPDADCTPTTCELNVGFISSADGAASWSKPRQLAGPMQLDWLPDTAGIATGGRMVGDYVSTSFMHGRAFPFFAEANPPKSDGSFDEAIATVPGGLRPK